MIDTGNTGNPSTVYSSNSCSQAASLLWVCAMLLLTTAMSPSVMAQMQDGATAQLTVNASQIVSPISPTLYGLMTEEINDSYEGGLYAEMIQNRPFHTNWEGEPPWDLIRRGNAVASRSLDRSSGPSHALSYSMKVSVPAAS